MPSIDLTDLELVEAARGQRMLRDQALSDAGKQESPGVRKIFERSAKTHQALADKFEQARASGRR